MRKLYCGDVHCTPGNLKESETLMQFVLDKAKELNVDGVEILGDIFNTHDIVRLSVIEFWDRWFHMLSDPTLGFKTTVVVGNHDRNGDYHNEYSALHPFIGRENSVFKIIYKPYVDGLYGYLPYIHDDSKFVEAANELANQGATVLISHPNFKGAVYDNGTPINNGANDSDLDSRFLHLIGGHIHSELETGRIWYVGTPRWLTKSCANKNKGIWLVTHNDDTGAIESKEFISTERVCTPIVSIKWNEGEEKPEIPENAKVDIELVGSSDWVQKTKKSLVGSVSISSKITDIKKSRERRSGRSLHEFLTKHYQAEPEKIVKLLKYMGDLNLV